MLNSILLVDDDRATNFIHKMVIEESGLFKECHVRENGEEALQFLMNSDADRGSPDVIVLDINMPVMNGWEFIEALSELEEVQKPNVVVVMLTTSLNPDDRMKAERLAKVDRFYLKPLNQEMLEEIVMIGRSKVGSSPSSHGG